MAGRCDMGGVSCSNLTATYFGVNPNGLATGGTESKTLTIAQLPPITSSNATQTINVSTATITSVLQNPTSINAGSTGAPVQTWTGGAVGAAASTGVNSISVTSSGTTSSPVSVIQPTQLLNYIIKTLPDTNANSFFGVASIGGMTGVIACGSGVTCSGNTISFSFVGVNSVQGMTGNITCGTGLTCSAGSISANTTTPQVLSSRTAAAALDLSAYSIIRTLSYSTVGDGGGATFKKVGSTAFTDTVLSSSSITGGSGYTNGTYLGVPFTGGSCLNVEGVVVVSGGSVTGVNFSPSGKGTGCAAGNVITTANTNIGGTGSGFSITISTINGPFASFTDAAGNHWQYANEPSSPPNVKQFGVKCDWTKAAGDAGSTNDTQNFQGALNYAAIITPPLLMVVV